MNMHELGMNMAWTVHEVIMIVGIKSMKYGPKFPNFMGAAKENLLCFEHEHGHVHAQEPWTIFAWVFKFSRKCWALTFWIFRWISIMIGVQKIHNGRVHFLRNELVKARQKKNG